VCTRSRSRRAVVDAAPVHALLRGRAAAEHIGVIGRGPLLLTLTLLLAPSALRAQPSALDTCGQAGRPWVAVAFAGPSWQAAMEKNVLADLRAGLAQKGIDACTLGHAGSSPPLAVLELSAHAEDRVAVSIQVHDALTEKRVMRDLNLSAFASDAHALAIAAAADELLRASWAELAIEDAPEPSAPPPEAVQRTLRHSLRPARVGARDRTLGVRFAASHHGGGLTLLGGDAYVGLWLAERVGLELGIGLRQGLQQDAAHGRIESRALGGTAEVALALLPRGQRFGLYGTLGAALFSLRLRGRAQGTASDAEGGGLDLRARAGVAGTLALSPAFALRAELGVGAPLLALEAADAGHVVTSTKGVELRGGLGAELRL